MADRYVRFMRRFPTADSLAAAPTAAVLAEWSGLGYNRRALALQRTAAAVVRDGWPTDVADLQRLPGIGPYTARALASLAFGQPVGVVDTNVRRWLVRRFGAGDSPRSLQALSDALAMASADGRVDAWTHASMEFGASVCRPQRPACAACPIAAGCPSRGRAAHVPVPRQPPLTGSDREIRGTIIRTLSASDGHAADASVMRAAITADADRWERVLLRLERDGLVQRDGGLVRLGGATIGA